MVEVERGVKSKWFSYYFTMTLFIGWHTIASYNYTAAILNNYIIQIFRIRLVVALLHLHCYYNSGVLRIESCHCNWSPQFGPPSLDLHLKIFASASHSSYSRYSRCRFSYFTIFHLGEGRSFRLWRGPCFLCFNSPTIYRTFHISKVGNTKELLPASKGAKPTAIPKV